MAAQMDVHVPSVRESRDAGAADAEFGQLTRAIRGARAGVPVPSPVPRKFARGRLEFRILGPQFRVECPAYNIRSANTGPKAGASYQPKWNSLTVELRSNGFQKYFHIRGTEICAKSALPEITALAEPMPVITTLLTFSPCLRNIPLSCA